MTIQSPHTGLQHANVIAILILRPLQYGAAVMELIFDDAYFIAKDNTIISPKILLLFFQISERFGVYFLCNCDCK